MKISKEPMSWNWKIYIETVVWLMDTNSSIPVLKQKMYHLQMILKEKQLTCHFHLLLFITLTWKKNKHWCKYLQNIKSLISDISEIFIHHLIKEPDMGARIGVGLWEPHQRTTGLKLKTSSFIAMHNYYARYSPDTITFRKCQTRILSIPIIMCKNATNHHTHQYHNHQTFDE